MSKASMMMMMIIAKMRKKGRLFQALKLAPKLARTLASKCDKQSVAFKAQRSVILRRLLTKNAGAQKMGLIISMSNIIA